MASVVNTEPRAVCDEQRTHFLLFEGPFLKGFDMATFVPIGFHPFDILLGGKMILSRTLGYVCVFVCVCVHMRVCERVKMCLGMRVQVCACTIVCLHMSVQASTCTCVSGAHGGSWFSVRSSHCTCVSGPSWSGS